MLKSTTKLTYVCGLTTIFYIRDVYVLYSRWSQFSFTDLLLEFHLKNQNQLFKSLSRATVMIIDYTHKSAG
jgi:hypothetical protein